MAFHFHGFVRGINISEIHGNHAWTLEDHLDPGFIAEFARAHEEAGFERVLIGAFSTGADGWAIGQHVMASTQRLSAMIAHRPGFVAPTVAARKALTLDQLSGGRTSLNIVTGGSDADMAKDGDWTTKEERYRRTDEYLTILRQMWERTEPFDHEGEFYRVAGAYSELRPTGPGSIPIFFGGASGSAVPVAAKHADVYMLFGEPLAAVEQRLAEVRAVTPPGRDPEFCVSFRPIVAETDELAWERAHAYLERIVAARGGQAVAASTRPGSHGADRLRAFASEQELFDTCLWMPIAAATGAGGNTTCLVGSPETVAQAIMGYYDIGVRHVLIRGFEPLEDVRQWGQALIPLVQAEVARREA